MHKNGQLRRFWKVLQGDLTTVTDRFSTALPKPDHSPLSLRQRRPTTREPKLPCGLIFSTFYPQHLLISIHIILSRSNTQGKV